MQQLLKKSVLALVLQMCLTSCDSIFDTVVEIENESEREAFVVRIEWAGEATDLRELTPGSRTKYRVNAPTDGTGIVLISDGLKERQYGISYVTSDQADRVNIKIHSSEDVTARIGPRWQFTSTGTEFRLAEY